MKKGKIITENIEIKHILADSKTIAILGLSPKLERDSHMVAQYLKEQGYKIIPVRPKQKKILGEKSFTIAYLDQGRSSRHRITPRVL